jgi:A/G-specific adenine glycosylase
MEFGALVCIPKAPKCAECPLHSNCLAFQQNKANQLPVKEKRTKQSKRYFYYYLLHDNNSVYMEKRTKNDIWKNLYQLPLVEHKNALSELKLLKCIPQFIQGTFHIKSVSQERKHILSHQVIYARVVEIELADTASINNHLIRVNKKDIYKFAVPRLIELFLNDFQLVDKQ